MTDSEKTRRLWDALYEATFEICHPCQEYVNCFSDDHCGLKCPHPDRKCFVRQWLQVLDETRPEGGKRP